MNERPRVGISQCLLGDRVRYDGGHKLDQALITAFSGRLEWVPVCPELEAGMGVPREPVHLIDDPARVIGIRLVGVTSGEDWTARMTAWATRRLRQLARLRLSGYVLKSRSPSCGPVGVPVLGAPAGEPVGAGLFARMLRDAFPDLPIEDEESLRAEHARARFLEQVVGRHTVRDA